MKVNDFGLLLTSFINNTNPNAKKELLTKCDNHRILLNQQKEKENKKKEYYINKFENIRYESNLLYQEYLYNRKILYDKWYNSRSLIDLQNLVDYKYPNIQIVPEIYTTNKLK